jgi:hypothetical protein
MAQCSACNTTILFGGVRAGADRYCNANCHARGALLRSSTLPAEAVRAEVDAVFHGRCPKCGGAGPVDVHQSFRVVSMVIMTQWKTTPLICCRGCGRKAQAGDLVLSLVAGWWGLPWGLLMTPIQIGRNIAAMVRAEPQQPSPDLERAVRIVLATRAAQPRVQMPPKFGVA